MLGTSAAALMHGQMKAKAVSDIAASSAFWINPVLATDAAIQLDRWLTEVSQSAATVYDKALDGVYLDAMRVGSTKALGGAYHRLFDGGHDLASAWKRVREALPDDTFGQEVSGYLSAIWKDVVTPMGLPVISFDKGRYDAVAEGLQQTLGVSYEWLYDLATFTATEGIGALVGALALVLKWRQAQVKEFSEIVGALGVTAMVSLNPILAVVVVLGAARTYQLSQQKDAGKGALKGLLSGSASSGSLIATSLMIGGPVWVGVIAGVVVSVLVRQGCSDKSLDRIKERGSKFCEIKGHELIAGARALMPALVRK
ncbi:hypothetical protein [Limibacillus halophilus]|uniref:Uncharacterized protein n=1 Tax=Limibacillus halophilus TaxID=1579333 RepID=A0A839SWD9_9PROT|nr:hypothetical protein [Limibacillus halophilus]MBB3066010.1 hypothetical protein [Limibacillus halophilus]